MILPHCRCSNEWINHAKAHIYLFLSYMMSCSYNGNDSNVFKLKRNWHADCISIVSYGVTKQSLLLYVKQQTMLLDHKEYKGCKES